MTCHREILLEFRVSMATCHLLRIGLLSLLVLGVTGTGSSQSLNASKLAQDLIARCAKAQTYSFDAQVQVEGWRTGEEPRLLAGAKVSFAAGPEGRYSLRMEPLGKEAYVLVSNGQKSWAYVPSLKKYTETEAAAAADTDDEGDDAPVEDERDLTELFVRDMVPELGRMGRTIEGAQISRYVNLKYQGKKLNWPVLSMVSKPDAEGSRNVTEVTLDPETLDIGRVLVARISTSNGVRTYVRGMFENTTVHLGEGVPDSTFEFEPPKKAQLVDAVPIPGQTGSFLLNQPAPDFELKTMDGDKVQLSEFRGHPVLLSFWASWCGPCRRELPEVARLYEDYKDKGLVVLGVNDEGKGDARKFIEKNDLPFPTVDDGNGKAHRLYRVRSIPSVFLIDAQGKIVNFFLGAKAPGVLKGALKRVGL